MTRLEAFDRLVGPHHRMACSHNKTPVIVGGPPVPMYPCDCGWDVLRAAAERADFLENENAALRATLRSYSDRISGVAGGMRAAVRMMEGGHDR